VSNEEYTSLLSRVKTLEYALENERRGRTESIYERVAQLETDVEKEREITSESIRGVYGSIKGVYYNMANMQTDTASRIKYMDEKVEETAEKTDHLVQDAKELSDKISSVDQVALDIEDRLDDIEVELDNTRSSGRANGKRHSSDVDMFTPFPLEQLRGPGPVFTGVSPQTGTWRVSISFVPSASQAFTYETGSVAYRRLFSRGLYKDIDIGGDGAKDFVSSIETCYKTLIAGRKWMPLITKKYRGSKKRRGTEQYALERLPEDKLCTGLWDRAFLQDYCAMADADGKVSEIFISLRDEKLTWEEIRTQPPFGDLTDRCMIQDSCWQQDDMLDGVHVDDEALDVGPLVEHPPSPKRKKSESEPDQDSSDGRSRSASPSTLPSSVESAGYRHAYSLSRPTSSEGNGGDERPHKRSRASRPTTRRSWKSWEREPVQLPTPRSSISDNGSINVMPPPTSDPEKVDAQLEKLKESLGVIPDSPRLRPSH
jgi:hypothetical protein